MSEERYLESVQRDILKSKKWKRFVRKFDIGVERPKGIKALPVRFVFYLPGDGKTSDHAFMQYDIVSYDITVAAFFYQCTSMRIIKQFLLHELVHHYLHVNDVPFVDEEALFNEALKYLGIDYDVKLFAMSRRKTGNDRRWMP